MQGMHDAVQIILQILRDPAMSGISCLFSLTSILLAFPLARKPQDQRDPSPTNFKKMTVTTHILVY
jgi:hypothetical protein